MKYIRVVVPLLLIIIVALTLPGSSLQAGPGDTLVTISGPLSQPRSVATDASSDIYVISSTDSYRVEKRDGSTGAVLTYFNFSFPLWDVAVDVNGDLYGLNGSFIEVVDSSNSFVTAIGVGYGSGPGELDTYADIAVDGTRVYVADSNNNRFQAFNKSDGSLALNIGSSGTGNGQFDYPGGIAVDDAGNIYVADGNNNRIQVFNSAGVYQSSIGTPGTGNGQFNYINAVAVNNTTDDIYAVDQTGRIQRFNSAGVYQDTPITEPRASDNDLAIDASGNVYFSSQYSHRVTKYTNLDVELVGIGNGAGELGGPRGVSVNSTGDIIVADTGAHRVQVFDNAGAYTSEFGVYGTANGEFQALEDVRVGPADSYYVADFYNGVQVFNSSGVFQTKLDASPSPNGGLYYPDGIDVDASGNTYVVDTINNRLLKFDNTNTYAAEVGGAGTGNGQFSGPSDVAVSSTTGNVFVTDYSNARVQVFDSNLNHLFNITDNVFYPFGVAVTNDNRILIQDSEIKVYDATGTFLGRLPGYIGFFSVDDIDFDAAGNMYLVSSLGNTVTVIEAPSFQTISGTLTEQGTGAVLSGHRVQIYDPAGSLLTEVTTDANGDYEAVAVEGTVRVYTSGYNYNLESQTHAGETYDNVAGFNISGGTNVTAGATGIDFVLVPGSSPTPTPTPTLTPTTSGPTNTPSPTPEVTPEPTASATATPGAETGNLEVGEDTDGGTILPTFKFTLAVDESGNVIPAEWINLVIFGADDMRLLDIWLPYDEYCEGAYCEIPLTLNELFAGLLEGSYSWQIRTWDESNGLSEFTGRDGFEVQVDPPGVPTNVQITTEGGRVVISLDFDPLAAWYHVVIKDGALNIWYDGWHRVEEFTCDETRCTFVLPALDGLENSEDGIPGLLNGSYSLQLSAWGPGGFNGEDENAASSESFELDVPEPGLASIPPDFAITNTDSGSPTFRWVPAENATYQLIWVGTPTGLPDALTTTRILTYHIRWYSVDLMECLEGEGNPCIFTPKDLFLANGDYEYWVLSWGPAGQSQQGTFLGWVQGPEFDVSAEAPKPATPTTPTGTLSKGVTTFSWLQVPGVTWYNLWVGTSTDGQLSTSYQNWFRATDSGCLETGFCEVDPDGLYLPEGDYVWYIQSYNPAWVQADSPEYWSIPPGEFKVDRP